MLSLVLPKGSLEKATFDLFDAADLTVRRGSDRDYRASVDDPRIDRVRVLRPQEIPTYLEQGLFDLGITGPPMSFDLMFIADGLAAMVTGFASAIVLAFVINRLFVFQTHRGWRSMVLFPFVYLAQYLVSLAVLWTWVERLHMSSKLAPLIAMS